MKRREVLKNIGLGAGYVMVAPAVFNLLQSCKSEPKSDWEPVYLNAANGYALTKILDVILPKGDTPGASDLNLAQFIDSYMNEVAGDKQKEEFKSGANAFALSFKENFDKELIDADDEDFENISDDKFVYLDKEFNIDCVYSEKYKLWKPLKVSDKQPCDKSQIIKIEKNYI